MGKKHGECLKVARKQLQWRPELIWIYIQRPGRPGDSIWRSGSSVSEATVLCGLTSPLREKHEVVLKRKSNRGGTERCFSCWNLLIWYSETETYGEYEAGWPAGRGTGRCWLCRCRSPHPEPLACSESERHHPHPQPGWHSCLSLSSLYVLESRNGNYKSVFSVWSLLLLTVRRAADKSIFSFCYILLKYPVSFVSGLLFYVLWCIVLTYISYFHLNILSWC